MRWASRYTLQHRLPPSSIRASSTTHPTTPLTTFLTPKPTLTHSSHIHADTMGWLPDLFGGSSSPRRSSSRARSYAGSSYSSASRHHASTSRYKRSPRDGYVAYLYAKLRHFMREIWRYAQRHPYKVFFMVIMPLVSGGVLHKLAKQFGVNLPGAPSARGASGGHSSSAGYYGSAGYGDERGGAAGGMGGFDMQSLAGGIGTAQSLAGGISGLASLAGMASKFM
ncbi:hypothetical protein CC86DRAFT_365850 [Ophiobolus disseminans]|uniref:Uncharacterized protein n=1 Tax=Ophiobolus disseminans TaxID=1469910 RepID=A0A6A7AF97_9PLEO|nr:hypothetical protein CC86DRAFT_365850 [Ophiobolus disseminans]